jgi:hypothetical protein
MHVPLLYPYRPIAFNVRHNHYPAIQLNSAVDAQSKTLIRHRLLTLLDEQDRAVSRRTCVDVPGKADADSLIRFADCQNTGIMRWQACTTGLR